MTAKLFPMSSNRYLGRFSTNGFTLIELMIVVAIVGILAALAYPSFAESIRKGKRAEAKAALMNLLQQQERYFTQNSSYDTFSVGSAGSKPFKDYSSNSVGSAGSSHLLGARACAPVGTVTPVLRDCVEVFAEPQSGIFSDPVVTSIAIDTMNRRSCNGSYTSTVACWK
jgi:type IV pilus assembly protein PilE